MARGTLQQQWERRRQVEHLELRGSSVSAMARALGCARRTIRTDLDAIALARAEATDIPRARGRLLEAAKVVERTAWELFTTLPASDVNGKLGALGKVLGAHAAQAALLGTLETATLAAEVAELREQLARLLVERGGVRLVGS